MDAKQTSIKFDSESFVKKFFPSFLYDNSYSQFVLTKLVQFVERSKLAVDSKKILEYGSGPHPVFALGLSPVANEIVLTEYEESHRDYVQKWLRKDPTSFNYTLYFDYVAGLIGKRGNNEVNGLEERLRRKIVAITSCDITKDQCITEDYEGPYDIVFSSLCLENATKSVQEFKKAMKKLVAMVKQEGYFILFCAIREKAEIGFYIVNNEKLLNLALKRKDLLEAGSECSLTLIEEDSLPVPPNPNLNTDYFSFFIWKK